MGLRCLSCCFLAGLSILSLQGCSSPSEPGRKSSTTTSRSPPATSANPSTLAPPPGPWPIDGSIRGVVYAPIPCHGPESCKPLLHGTERSAYIEQWGSDGRDDFGILQSMGVNFVRLPDLKGSESNNRANLRNQEGFLDALQRRRSHVFAAVARKVDCPEDNCFSAVFEQVATAWTREFKAGQTWHPAVALLDVLTEVNAQTRNVTAQVKRIVSAANAIIMAEETYRVDLSSVVPNLTSCFKMQVGRAFGDNTWSFHAGFNSMEYWFKNPTSLNYEPTGGISIQNLSMAIQRRWMHCINTNGSWGIFHNQKGVKDLVADHYDQFLPRPWFVGSMGFNGVPSDIIKEDLSTMQALAGSGQGFKGVFVKEFQTAYEKTGEGLNFGVFGLGGTEIGYDVRVNNTAYSVNCLTTLLYAFQYPYARCKSECQHRAEAVAAAFGGKVSGRGVCVNQGPMEPSQDPADHQVDLPAPSERAMNVFT